MDSTENVVALVGAGKGGKAILADLLLIPGTRIKYVCDSNPEAPGLRLAQKNNITCIHDIASSEILKDPEIDLIFEVTGQAEVYQYLVEHKRPSCNLMGASTTKIIFHLLDTQRKITAELKQYKEKLEERIIERTEDLEKTNIKLQEKVYEFERLNEKLQQVNNEKTKYLLQATHQLKAPFAAIQSYTDILLDGYTGDLPDKTTAIIGKIKTRCIFLSNSIKEMLELANLNTFLKENIKMQPQSLKEIIGALVENSASILEKRHLKINLASNTDDDTLQCDKAQLKILLTILIENAINYSKDNSSIEIKILRNSKNKLELSVTDHGIGIAEENLDKIFDDFFRANNAVKIHENGTGLGLTIAKRIAEIHGCNILVDSMLDQGTTFRLIF